MIGPWSGDLWRSAGGSPGEFVLRYLPKTIICQNVQVGDILSMAKIFSLGFLPLRQNYDSLQTFKNIKFIFSCNFCSLCADSVEAESVSVQSAWRFIISILTFIYAEEEGQGPIYHWPCDIREWLCLHHGWIWEQCTVVFALSVTESSSECVCVMCVCNVYVCEGGGGATPPSLPAISQFRNNLCKDDSALFSRFLHGVQPEVKNFLTLPLL